MDKALKGFYNPAILGIFVNGKDDDILYSFVHEFTHHINYISSTYSIHVIIEKLEVIENMIYDLGGIIVCPSSFRKKKLFYGTFQEPYIDHLKMFNGNTESYRITSKKDLEKYILDNKIINNEDIDGLWKILISGNPEQNNIGISMLDSYCIYHYLRWNFIKKIYFITKLGLDCLLECNAYLISQICIGKSRQEIEFDKNRFLYNIKSYMHAYTAPLEILFESCKNLIRTQEDKENLIKLLSMMIDICLQMPISYADKRKKPNPYTPSIYFMSMVQELKKLHFIPNIIGNEKNGIITYLILLKNSYPQNIKETHCIVL